MARITVNLDKVERLEIENLGLRLEIVLGQIENSKKQFAALRKDQKDLVDAILEKNEAKPANDWQFDPENGCLFREEKE